MQQFIQLLHFYFSLRSQRDSNPRRRINGDVRGRQAMEPVELNAWIKNTALLTLSRGVNSISLLPGFLNSNSAKSNNEMFFT